MSKNITGSNEHRNNDVISNTGTSECPPDSGNKWYEGAVVALIMLVIIWNIILTICVFKLLMPRGKNTGSYKPVTTNTEEVELSNKGKLN